MSDRTRTVVVVEEDGVGRREVRHSAQEKWELNYSFSVDCWLNKEENGKKSLGIKLTMLVNEISINNCIKDSG